MEHLEIGFGFGVVPRGVGNWAQRSFLFGLLHSSVIFGAAGAEKGS